MRKLTRLSNELIHRSIYTTAPKASPSVCFSKLRNRSLDIFVENSFPSEKCLSLHNNQVMSQRYQHLRFPFHRRSSGGKRGNYSLSQLFLLNRIFLL